MSAVTIPLHRLTPGKARARTRSPRLRQRPRRLLREMEQTTEVTRRKETSHEHQPTDRP